MSPACFFGKRMVSPARRARARSSSNQVDKVVETLAGYRSAAGGRAQAVGPARRPRWERTIVLVERWSRVRGSVRLFHEHDSRFRSASVLAEERGDLILVLGLLANGEILGVVGLAVVGRRLGVQAGALPGWRL